MTIQIRTKKNKIEQSKKLPKNRIHSFIPSQAHHDNHARGRSLPSQEMVYRLTVVKKKNDKKFGTFIYQIK